MSCPHGHPSRPEEEYGSGECYTCLEKTEPCRCNYCFKCLQDKIDHVNPDAMFPITPDWYRAFVKQEIGVVTAANYDHACQLASHDCHCKTKEDASHDDQECFDEECIACGFVRCPEGEPLHFHHDGCPAEAEDEDV